MPDDAVPRPLHLAAAVSWRAVVIAAALVVLAYVVAHLQVVLVPVFIALLFATQLSPLVAFLHARRVPRSLAALGCVLLGLAVIAGIAAAVVGTVAAEFDRLEADVESGLDEIGDFLVEDFDIPRENVEAAIDDLLDSVRNNTGTILGGVFTGALLALQIAAGTVLAIVLLFFFLKDGPAMWEWGLQLLPHDRRPGARHVGERVWDVLSRYFRGTLAVALFDGLAIGLALLVIGVPLVLPLAIITFFGGFIPIVGAVTAGLVAVLVALVGEGLTDALLVGLAVLAIQQLEGNVFAPVLVGRSLNLHPTVVILGVIVGGLVWGVIGAALAVPVIAVLAAIVAYAANPHPPADAIDAAAGEGNPGLPQPDTTPNG